MNGKVAPILEGARAPGLYRLTSTAGPASIAALAQRYGWRFCHLDGERIASKADFLAACRQAMNFPHYFGNNWDALTDSLRDLSWAPASKGYLVLFDNAGEFAARAPKDFQVALEILKDSIAYWHGTETPMTVLLRGAGRAAAGVPRI
jgi:RNAse (barnase) inhibitor barstar